MFIDKLGILVHKEVIEVLAHAIETSSFITDGASKIMPSINKCTTHSCIRYR